MEDPRTRGVKPGKRRLELGLTSVIGREDGSVIEVFPDGSETLLVAPRDRESDPVKEQSTDSPRPLT